MWLAAAHLSLWAKQIEADLAFKGIDIAWWHRGTLTDDGTPKLSSRRLLVLLDELDEDSCYKTAKRDGAWPTWKRMLQSLTNDTALARASQYAGGDNEYTPLLFVDPNEQQQKVSEAAAEEALRDEVEADLSQSFGFT